MPDFIMMHAENTVSGDDASLQGLALACNVAAFQQTLFRTSRSSLQTWAYLLLTSLRNEGLKLAVVVVYIAGRCDEHNHWTISAHCGALEPAIGFVQQLLLVGLIPAPPEAIDAPALVHLEKVLRCHCHLRIIWA